MWPTDDGIWLSAFTVNEDFEMHYLSAEGEFKSWDLNILEGSMPEFFY